jgi:signal transduction histidine kinase
MQPTSVASPTARWFNVLVATGCWLWGFTGSAALQTSAGLPLNRFHSIDEIGSNHDDFLIHFDPSGRLSMVQNGNFAVLNDRTWMHVTEFDQSTEVIHSVLQLSEDEAYYGAGGSWGKLVRSPEGGLQSVTLAPALRPGWTHSNNYLILFPFSEGICFANWNGLVYWNKDTRHTRYIEVPELSTAFALGASLFVSSAEIGLQRVDLDSESLQPVINALPIHQHAFYHHAPFSAGVLLCATRRYGLSLFDGKQITPWTCDIDSINDSNITALCRLPEGNFAISLEGKGLFILNPSGRMVAAYTTPEFLHIRRILSREPGIVWFTTESGIEQVNYGSRVNVVDKRQGIPINWPQVVSWRGRTVIASNGRLFQSADPAPLQSTAFKLVENQPDFGTWGIASDGTTLLTGNRLGVYERVGPDQFKRVLADFPTDRLVMIGEKRCYVIGKDAITLIENRSDAWVAITPTIAGVGYPTVVHRAGQSVWIELGVHRVARISHRQGRLHTQVFEHFPWQNKGWIHVGVVEDLVVLSSPTEGRLFFRESLDAFVDTPPEWERLDQLPHLIGRMKQDSEGTVWVSHYQGISPMHLRDGSYTIATAGFQFVNASYPILHLTADQGVWFNTSSNLYQVVPENEGSVNAEPPRPRLLSIHDQQTGRAIPLPPGSDPVMHLSYQQNSLSFLFFAGTYALRNPRYQYEIEGPRATWNFSDADSRLNLPNLPEGRYQITVQLTENRFPTGEPFSLMLVIAAPWYRTLPAYLFYSLFAALVFFLCLRWLLHRTRRHNRLLSTLVAQRTKELSETMSKLETETRNAATLAERDRLAGEIHDSVQQGLTGLMIHIDGMLRSSAVSDDLRSNLSTARKMVDYTRKEVQHALLNMESPLLEDADLSSALKRIADLIPRPSSEIIIQTSGTPYLIPATHAHQLLRICQEAMTNAVRHSRADTISIRVDYQKEHLQLLVHDNGQGFDPDIEGINQSLHFGLRGMRNRAKSIGSTFSIASKPGQGARISITLPRQDPATSYA